MRKKKEEREKIKSDFFGGLFLSSHIVKGTFASELFGSIILSACLVWGL